MSISNLLKDYRFKLGKYQDKYNDDELTLDQCDLEMKNALKETIALIKKAVQDCVFEEPDELTCACKKRINERIESLFKED